MVGLFFSAKAALCKGNANADAAMLVRTERLELSHLSILEPKSSASTNSATSALWSQHERKLTLGRRIIPNRLFLPSIASTVAS